MTQETELLIHSEAPQRDAATTLLDVTPTQAGWEFSGLQVIALPAGTSWRHKLEDAEALLLPLAGGPGRVSAIVPGETAEQDWRLEGRKSVFEGGSDALFLPVGSEFVIEPAGQAPVKIAVATAKATKRLAARYLPRDQVRIEPRGAGNCSRLVRNYTLATDVEIDHLLVCEVITPGGNWSSYPPHKHDVHSDDERVLEEIYYFEVADGPNGAGLAYHRTYGTPAKPIDFLAEIRSGDCVIVPHGYHGPCMAAPGYDLYYLNVMAGPAEDGKWLVTDDPAFGWVRDTWQDAEIDPRILGESTPNAAKE